MKISGIYCIKNIKNNKVYIGQAMNISERFYAHKHALKYNIHNNPLLQNSWNKHGKEFFEFTIIEKCCSEQLNEKEIYYISLYNSYKHGYNRTPGGVGLFRIVLTENIIKIRKQNGKKLAQYIKELRNNNKNKCLECGAETESGYHRYCINHKQKCIKCGKRFPNRGKHSSICLECKHPINDKIRNNSTNTCIYCGKKIIKNSNRQKFCLECGKKETRKRQREYMWIKRHL